MANKLEFERSAGEKLVEGVNKLANAVMITLGPKGRNVMLERGESISPHVTKDGVSVAKNIILEDSYENMGAQMTKEVASKTADKAGDGTTTATVLAQAITREGFKNVTAGANPMDLKKGIDSAVDCIVEELDVMSKQVQGKKDIQQIATISSNNDTDIGNLIADAMDKVGNDGVITIEESSTAETTLSVVDGLQIDRGYLSPYFVTDTERMQCNLENPLILITDQKISNIQDIMHLLDASVQANRPVLIIADDVEGEALATLVLNKMRGVLRLAIVKAPGFGDRKKEVLQDIASVTGSEVILTEVGMKLSETQISSLGSAKNVTIDKDSTIIVDGAGTVEAIQERVKVIKGQIASSTSEYETEKHQERLAKLSGGVAVINVGASTETEMKEKKDRVDDALNATKAAVEDGIVPGGGVALIRASQNITEKISTDNHDINVGISIVKKAIEEPLRQIVNNAGQEPSVVVNKVVEGTGAFGYNAKTDTYEDLIESGVVDPTKVTKTALRNAASIASMILTTNCVVATIKEENNNQPLPPAAPGMGGLM